jgi:ABC-type antimicrobial peptide transport system permease subunit
MLSAIFGSLVLGLTAIGLYGVMVHSVARRRREIAIRMAIGASGAGVIAVIFSRASGIVAVGLTIGSAAAFWTARYASTLLFGIKAVDSLAYSGATILVVLVSLLATLLPSRRAARVDPSRILREE